jgi:hypothetical protein
LGGVIVPRLLGRNAGKRLTKEIAFPFVGTEAFRLLHFADSV